VTHVALDHCDRLGNTHVEIARDKVQIARAGRILVTAETRDDVLQLFRAHCDEIGARLWPWRAREYSNDAARLSAVLSSPSMSDSFATATGFQQLNACTARLARVALEG
jgi:folylpolyglutamate synthase/dihydropteroate synthase